MEKIKNQLAFRFWGRYALFSDPITRMGGEKSSYPVPTYQALKGAIESVYWKPSILWVIDAVRIMKPIRTEAKNIRPVSYNSEKNTLSVYTYLSDVEYQVLAHFLPNPYRPELARDGANENKHYFIAKRMLERGGRRDVFLGTRECQAYAGPCVFHEGAGAYDGQGEKDLGVMVHGFDYPDETGCDMLSVRLWHAKMTDGIIEFPAPWNCDPAMKRCIRPMKAKQFCEQRHNFSGASEASFDGIGGEEEQDELDHKTE